MDQPVADQTFELAITGMSCASCVSRVEKVLGRVPGVRAVSVNLATETAHLRAAGGTGLAPLIAAVSGAGFAASLAAPAEPDGSRREVFELAVAALLAAPLCLAMLLPVPGAVQPVLASLIQFWLGARFYRAGYAALRAGSGNMDLLVALGTSAAYGLSVVDFCHGGPLYFESSAAVITLIRLGKCLERRAKSEVAQTLRSLAHLRPATAHVPGRGEVLVAGLAPGDLVEIRPGARVPADGVIMVGFGSLDESPVTGEALPAARGPGALLLAGTLNLDSPIVLRVTAPPGESFLDRMARLVEAAQSAKGKTQKLVDRIAAVFVPVVLGIAVVTCAAWLCAGAPPAQAIINAVSVLVIACPCALGLATPAAILAGTGAAARLGLLLRNADALAAAARVDCVVFDKTGTLTEGKPRLERVICLAEMPEAELRAIAARLAAADTHPLAAALRQPGSAPAEALRVIPGGGVSGVVAGQPYVLGSAALTGAAAPAEGPQTWSYLARADGLVLAGFAFTDAIRPGAPQAVARLRAMGCEVTLLSGDRAAAAQSVGAALGIKHIVADTSPAQKITTIRALQAEGRVVAMVGDGINDAAALAAADLGMAMGTGSDTAIEMSDVSLLRPELALVPAALQLARKTGAILRGGLFWAMFYNLIGIPAAAFGMLSPTVAGGAMAASSLCVLANALRLRRWRPAP